MIPVKSNLTDTGCAPVSSNCVTWQGPNISCINLCNGDNVSDVVYKLATELCSLMDQLNLTDLNLDCLVQACVQCPQPDKTLATVLQLLIDKVCTLEDLIGTGSGSSGGGIQNVLLTVAPCFRTNDINGDPVHQYTHTDYTLKIGLEVCRIQGVVNQQGITLANHEVRILDLENNTGSSYTPPKVTPNCVVTPGVPAEMDVVLDALEEQFCQLRSAVGTPSQISTALAKQCVGLAQFNALSTSGTLGSISGFVTGSDPLANTVAGTLVNMWITLCDLRAAFATLKGNLGTLDCSTITIDFTVAATGTNGARDQITLYFNGLTTIPTGLTECNQQGSKVTITDSAGNKYVTYIQVVANKTNASGVAISLANTPINTSLNYTVFLETCVMNSDKQSCNKEVTKTLNAPCPTITVSQASVNP